MPLHQTWEILSTCLIKCWHFDLFYKVLIMENTLQVYCLNYSDSCCFISLLLWLLFAFPNNWLLMAIPFLILLLIKEFSGHRFMILFQVIFNVSFNLYFQPSQFKDCLFIHYYFSLSISIYSIIMVIQFYYFLVQIINFQFYFQFLIYWVNFYINYYFTSYFFLILIFKIPLIIV